MIYAVHDYDYFHYQNVIPNLECAKILAGKKRQRDIALLVPTLEPERYSGYYIGKDYYDGIYPKEMFSLKCKYGGRAITPKAYKPFPNAIEYITPDFSPYEKYMDRFGDDKTIKRILRAAHCRLSSKEKYIDDEALDSLQITPQTSGIIIHDWHPEKVEGITDCLWALSHSRNCATKEGINILPIGMKFPARVRTEEDFFSWLRLPQMPEVFSLEYDGPMSNETARKLVEKFPAPASRRIIYNPTATTSSEKEVIEILPLVYRQCLYLLRNKINLLLVLEEFLPFSLAQEIKDFFILMGEFLPEFSKKKYCLYYHCRSVKEHHEVSYFTENIRKERLTNERVRNMFMFMREKNYELFKMFYETDLLHYEKGDFVSD